MFHKDGPSFLELTRQALSSTERGYDLLAEKFEYTPFRTPDEVIDACAQHFGNAASALDLCCGTGAGLRPMVGAIPKVVGLDMSRGMLNEASRHLGRHDSLTLVRGDALRTHFEDGEFDLVTCHGAFGHILPEDEAPFIQEIFRILKPGGRFVFATSRTPDATSPSRWVAEGFNAVMRVRNAILKPEFVMYYLTFMLPDVQGQLEREGFTVETHEGQLTGPLSRVVIVVASKPA